MTIHDNPFDSSHSGTRVDGTPSFKGLKLASFILAAYVLFAGYALYTNLVSSFRSEVERQLAAVADLKAGEIQLWRRERLADAQTFHGNQVFLNLVERAWSEPADAEAGAELENWLTLVQSKQQYQRVMLFDRQGRVRLAIPAHLSQVDELSLGMVSEVLVQQQVAFGDIHRHGPEEVPHLSTLVPLSLDGAQPRQLGVLALFIDPEQHLFPLLNRWPYPSETAETALIRREGDGALIVNDLRVRDIKALDQRILADQVDHPAIKAVNGGTGYIEGHCFHDVPVAAYLRDIPDSPWFLVASMDRSEAYAPMYSKMWLFALIGGLLLVSFGGVVAVIWRQQKVRYYRKQLESEQERAWLREMIERCDYEFYVFDPETMLFAFANQGACYKLGYSDEEMSRLTPVDLIPEFSVVEFRSMYGPLRAGSESLQVRVTQKRKDGTLYPTEIYLQQVATRSGDMMLMLSRDITESLRQENELERRTAEMERFTYTVSHELKTPLVTINTYLGYLEHSLDTGTVASFKKEFGYMHGATLTMGRLLEDLLEMARLGHVIRNQDQVSWQSLMSVTKEALAARIRERGVTVQIGVDDVMLCGDRRHMEEILQNLVENAVKYMGGQPVPRIELGMETVGRDTVFFVRDNGIGISPRYHSKVFGMFEKLDPGSEGSGMGLALVKRVVELYDGTLWVESDGEGRGSRFCFTLPGALKAQPAAK